MSKMPDKEEYKEINLGSLVNADTIALTFNTTLKDTDTIKSYQLFAKNRTNQQLLTVPFLALNRYRLHISISR